MKPSLTEFMAPVAAPVMAPRRSPDVKTLTIRPTIEQWEALLALTTTERTKISPYIFGLIRADFAQRGLRWPA